MGLPLRDKRVAWGARARPLRRAITIGLLLLSAVLAGQNIAAAPPPVRFEVVSIKLVPNLDVNGSQHSVGAVDPGLWRSHQAVLIQVIRAAYGINFSESLDDQLIRGAPAWVNNNEFDIDARIPAHASRSQVPLMLQAMLAEHFGLRIHWDSRPLPAVAMSVAPGGPKLTRDTACESPNLAIQPLIVPTDRAAVEASQANPGCGATGTSINGSVRTIKFHGYTMPQLAAFIGRNQIVVDHTGLVGAYDFTLSYNFVPIQDAPRDQWNDIDEQNLRLRIAAYRKQLGLTIVLTHKVTLPVPVLVIDHIEKPAGN